MPQQLMNTYLLEEMTWPEISAAIKNGMRTVIIFTASTEQHGLHLAENTDTVLAYAEAAALAEKLGNALVAPVIRPGLSEHHMAMPGSITLRPEVFAGLVQDYIAAYVKHGFETIIVTSSHGGNFAALEQIVEAEQEKYPDKNIITACSLKEMTITLLQAEKMFGLPAGACGGHACDFETSVMLETAPQYVRMDKAEAGYVGPVNDEFLRKFFVSGVTAVSENGVLGDPVAANAERGRVYLEKLIDLMESAVRKKLNR